MHVSWILSIFKYCNANRNLIFDKQVYLLYIIFNKVPLSKLIHYLRDYHPEIPIIELILFSDHISNR
jgi:hypothetical protein